METAIILENVSKTFKLKRVKRLGEFFKPVPKDKVRTRLVALDGISLKISKGEVFGIVGPNGSGKTTLLRIIAGIYNSDLGTVTVNGKIAPLLQIGVGFHRELTAEENIIISGMLYGLTKEQIMSKIPDILRFSELEDFSQMKLKHFSAGMRLRLAFSSAIQIDPDILIIDEILAVGDMSFRKKSLEFFLDFKKRNKTIILTTHSVNLIKELCDRVLLLEKGKALMIGNPIEVIQKLKEISK